MPPGSAIIGTASEQAYDPSPDLYDYAQTKAATMNVKSLAKQLASKGIRANAVAPGPIWTPLQVNGGATQRKGGEVRRPDSPRPTQSTCGARIHLRSARDVRCELRDRSGLRLLWRSRAALIVRTRAEAAEQAGCLTAA